MQGRIISEQILLDAKEQCDKILLEAKETVEKEKKEYQEFKKHEKEESDARLEKRIEAIKADLDNKKSVEEQKMLYKRQQSTLFDLKNNTKKSFLALDKDKKLHFVDNILSHHSEGGEKVLIKISGLKLDDVKTLPIVKKNKLVLAEGYDEGIILSSADADKNFLLDTLVEEALQRKESEIYKLLF